MTLNSMPCFDKEVSLITRYVNKQTSINFYGWLYKTIRRRNCLVFLSSDVKLSSKLIFFQLAPADLVRL